MVRSYSEEGGDENIEKHTLDWNPQGTRRGRAKQIWERIVLEEAENWATHGARLGGWRVAEWGGDASQMRYIVNRMKGCADLEYVNGLSI